MNKQNLWFLTLLSLILVLGIYYVTMPNELLLGKGTNKKVKEVKEVKTEVKEVATLEAMRVSKQEEREEKISSLQKELTKEGKTTEEKNSYYEQLKYLNELQGKEEKLEKKIKEQLNLDCFIKIDKENISSVCASEKHDNKLANNVMRTIQEEYKEKMYITVKFEKM